jgi:hypothetical protein
MRRAELKEKVLHFCGENPEVVDTCEGLARWIGCPVEEIKPILEVMVTEGILVRDGRAGQNIYFTRNSSNGLGVKRKRSAARQKQVKEA